MKTTSLRLAKQNFKFSSAHFLIFDQKSAEMLHGHNYQVVVSILAPDVGNDSDSDGKMGYMVDFNVLKKFIKTRLDIWDEHVLLPKNHPDMKYTTSSNGKNFEVTFRDRFYSLPKEEVIWLNCSNTSVEQLSSILAEEFFKEFKKYGIAKLTVAVEETRGQSAATTIE